MKVTDFGVSAELQNSIAMCAPFVGTLKYMSPGAGTVFFFVFDGDFNRLWFVVDFPLLRENTEPPIQLQLGYLESRASVGGVCHRYT